MKRLILFTVMLSAITAFAQQAVPVGKVIEEQNIKSDILKHNVKYAIYLPPDYETANRSYPVDTCCMDMEMTKPAGCNLVKLTAMPTKLLPRVKYRQ